VQGIRHCFKRSRWAESGGFL